MTGLHFLCELAKRPNRDVWVEVYDPMSGFLGAGTGSRDAKNRLQGFRSRHHLH